MIFVTGRLKDLIIIRGRNLYPQDIEQTIEKSHPIIRSGCGAAFSIDVAGEERLVIVQEVEYHRRQGMGCLLNLTIERIRQVVSEAHDVQPYAVALIKPGGISKTTSGKDQRHACRDDFLKGGLNVLAQWQIADEGGDAPTASLANPPQSEQDLRRWLAAKLGMDPAR